MDGAGAVDLRNMERLRQIAETGLGVILAVTPAVLWIAWTPELLLWAMAVAAACGVLLVLITRSASEGATGATPLPEEFIDEVHRLFPLTYHHSLRETPRFRAAMKRLAAMSERTGTSNTA